MIEQQLREIASHINALQRQQFMFIEETRTLRDDAAPGLSSRLAEVNARMDALQVVTPLTQCPQQVPNSRSQLGSIGLPSR